MNRGYLLIFSGYAGWGLFPLYWSLLAHVSPFEILLHRMIWAAPFLLPLILLSPRRRGQISVAIRSLPEMRLLLVSSLFISLNWGVYIWAVANQRVIEASMGYFLTPLLNVLVGVLIFGETLDRLKLVAVSCAAAGVIFYILAVGIFPWVGLTLGISFAAYGLLRKKMNTNAIPGLFIETLILLPFTAGSMLWLHSQGSAAFLNYGGTTDLWLILGGLVTVIPLALFTAGARLLPMVSVGILFYLTPTMQFLCGIWFFDETFDLNRLIGFSGIWIGLLIFSYSLFRDQPPDRPEVA